MILRFVHWKPLGYTAEIMGLIALFGALGCTLSVPIMIITGFGPLAPYIFWIAVPTILFMLFGGARLSYLSIQAEQQCKN